jgi:hypothetical protein
MERKHENVNTNIAICQVDISKADNDYINCALSVVAHDICLMHRSSGRKLPVVYMHIYHRKHENVNTNNIQNASLISSLSLFLFFCSFKLNILSLVTEKNAQRLPQSLVSS